MVQPASEVALPTHSPGMEPVRVHGLDPKGIKASPNTSWAFPGFPATSWSYLTEDTTARTERTRRTAVALPFPDIG